MICAQCDHTVSRPSRETVEAYPGDLDPDDAPLWFCSAGCAGAFFTDLAVA